MLTVKNDAGVTKARIHWAKDGVEISLGIDAYQSTTFTREQAQELVDKILTILKGESQ